MTLLIRRGVDVYFDDADVRVVKMVLTQAAILAAAGTALGLIASFWLKRFVEYLLFDVTSTDPVTYAGIAIVLGAVTLVATYLPARRASRVQPIVALRSQ